MKAERGSSIRQGLRLSEVEGLFLPSSTSVAAETDASRRQRDQIARLLQAYEQAKASGISQRDFAASQGIPHSSLQYWLAWSYGLTGRSN